MVELIEKTSPARVNVKAYAKINLALDVLGKREHDNYHEVAMIMQSVGLFDTIILEDAPCGVSLATDNSELTAGEDNLACRAAVLLKDYCQIERGVKITIEKKIPLAAGLAGGSADAAATLRGLIKLWGISLKREEIFRLGAALGSDVPFCLHGGTMLATGRGEIITPLPSLPKCYAVLAKPPLSVSTAWVYGNFRLDGASGSRPSLAAMLACLEKGDLKGVAERLSNVLETVTIKAYPQIALLKEQMLACGAIAALMSGSGPTVFGLTETEEMARNVATKLASLNEDCEVYIAEMIDTFIDNF